MPVIINGTTGISGVDGSAGTPAFQGSDTNTGIRFGTDIVSLVTSGSDRLYIDSSGRLGVGTTSPSDSQGFGNALDIRGSTGAAYYSATSDNNTRAFFATFTGGGYIGTETNHPLVIRTNNIERTRIDTSGRLLVGTSSARSTFFGANYTSALQVETASVNNPNGLSIGVNTSDDNPANLYLFKTRGTSVGSNTAVQNGDVLGNISFIGANGTDLSNTAAWIRCIVDGVPFSSGDTTDLPGALVFSTTADGASLPTERMRIGNEGNVYINKGSTSFGTAGTVLYGGSAANGAIDLTRSAAYSIAINRLTSDGNLIEFYRDTVQQGTISVSGSTVSYNGAHLSRWSQLPFGVEREEILRGSVLSNIDEMCEWGDEENEQLNRMKVSDVEGDKNVSGVFQAWDDDDDTYTDDFYCAMTGDFIIRIAEGVTVERGDLLMSAGDGTAKPQGDGYIQDKTIAKVTSTNVSCIYADGSYCVPCVLMAC